MWLCYDTWKSRKQKLCWYVALWQVSCVSCVSFIELPELLLVALMNRSDPEWLFWCCDVGLSEKITSGSVMTESLKAPQVWARVPPEHFLIFQNGYVIDFCGECRSSFPKKMPPPGNFICRHLIPSSGLNFLRAPTNNCVYTLCRTSRPFEFCTKWAELCTGWADPWTLHSISRPVNFVLDEQTISQPNCCWGRKTTGIENCLRDLSCPDLLSWTFKIALLAMSGGKWATQSPGPPIKPIWGRNCTWSQNTPQKTTQISTVQTTVWFNTNSWSFFADNTNQRSETFDARV